ncbi:MAG: T9SS type A sorting domain-containing protein, partial [Bacteroidota bacterium]
SLTYPGVGVYKSTDAGTHWTHIGLDSTMFIGRIVVAPSDANVLYVAAMGSLFGKNEQRGIFKSTTGGTTWEKVLYISDSTGCIDIVIHPTQPNILYAAMWERTRRPNGRTYGGVTSGVYKSTTSGSSWFKLESGLPNPTSSPFNGRIGLAIALSNPQVLYAKYADDIGYFAGVYKTVTGGDSWTRTNDGALAGIDASYGWWFGNIRIHPANQNIIYALGYVSYKSTNAGADWNSTFDAMHVDHHALYIHPASSNIMLEGNDGGLYISDDGGGSWTHSEQLPITQFYTCEVDYQFPERMYGGTQDNGTNRTLTGNLNDWSSIFGGDGFVVRVDPTNSTNIYAEYQWGSFARSTDGGSSFSYAMEGINTADRFNWNTPFTLDKNNPSTLYIGSEKLYKSTTRAEHWDSISNDLTNGNHGHEVPFGTITTIDVARTDTNYILVGTDDGNVQITKNSGAEWINISSTLPDRWITRVCFDEHDKNTAYVTLSGYRWNEYIGHIYRTTNAGNSWSDISANLPEAPINDIIVDPDIDSALYIASDFGVFYSFNLGSSWSMLDNTLPNVPITDLTFHQPSRTLIAATYGRSMYKAAIIISDVKESNAQFAAKQFQLEQNYPNPFNPQTTIGFSLLAVSNVTLKVYDILGKEIAVLIDNEKKEAGRYTVPFDGTNVPSGMYLCKLTSGNASSVRKMLLIK